MWNSREVEIIYCHSDIRKFIRALDKTTSRKVIRTIKVLQMEGYNIAMPYSKMIERDIYELRVKSNQNIRVFYTFMNQQAMVLHVIIKKTQKLEKHDLETVRTRLKYLQNL